MQKEKRILMFLLLCIVGTFALYAGGAKEPEKIEKISIKIYTSYPPGDENYVTAQAFAERVKALSNGMITAEVFHSGSVGGEKETVQAVKLGAAQGVSSGFLPVTMFTQEYGFFEGLYLYKDFDHYKAVWEGKPGQGIQKILLENNLRTMGIYMRGMRHLAANKPIRTPEDAKGLKLRTPQVPSMVKTFAAIGFLPTPIALPELFTALQTGVVDCAEGPASQMLSYKYNEVLKYLMLTGHSISGAMFNLSERFLKSLNSEQRAIVEKAAREAVAEGAAFAAKAEKEKLDKLVNSGMMVVEPDKEAFMEKAAAANEELFRTQWKVTTLEEIRSYMK
ncbi:MAG: TRAP transporter substrate-binding protein [Spirochaetales bacterium]